jgi:hypothetical protein
VVGDVRDDRPLEPHRRVVPAELPARRVAGRVEAVAGVRREVDPADEGDAVVEDDELLVVAVHGPLPRVEADPDPRSALERVAQAAHVPAGGAEERERRSRPEEHADRDALGELGEDRAHLVLRRGAEAEGRRHVPACDVDVRLGAPQLLGDPRQRFRPVDEHLDGVARSRRRVAACPVAVARVERVLPADATQSPAVVRADRALDRVADPVVELHRGRPYPELADC